MPISDYALKCDRTDLNVIRLIVALKPKCWFIENPRAMMRKMPWMAWAPRYTVTYCQYGDTRMHPTDLWTNIPDPRFKPPCKNGDPCHDAAPRGAKAGTQALNKIDKGRIPDELCRHIVTISESYIERLDAANEWLISQGKEPITPILDDEPKEPKLF